MVASLVLLSSADCVVAVMPLARAPTLTCAAGSAVAFVSTKAVGVPSAGVIIVQEVVMQKLPVPLMPVHAHVETLEVGAANSIT